LSWEDGVGDGSGHVVDIGGVGGDLVSVVSALLELFFHADAEAFFVIGVALQDGVFAEVGQVSQVSHKISPRYSVITIMRTRGESYGVFAVCGTGKIRMSKIERQWKVRGGR
jgi:hypothetical protein